MPAFETDTRPIWGDVLLDEEILNNLSYKEPIMIRILRILFQEGYLNQDDEEMVKLCLDEAIKNAMLHGNRLRPESKVKIRLCGDEDQWGVFVEDEGDGMKKESVPEPIIDENNARESGYGIILMDSVMDEVVYMNNGNRLLMTRHRSPKIEGSKPYVVPEITMPSEEEILTIEYVCPASELSDVPDSLEFHLEDSVIEGKPSETPTTSETTKESSEPITGADLISETKAMRIYRKKDIPIFELMDKQISDFNLAQVRKELIESIRGENVVILDLRNVTYISSVVLGTLVGLYKELRNNDSVIRLSSLNPTLQEVFKTTRLDTVFSIFPNIDAAIQATE